LAYVKELIKVMQHRTTRDSILEGLDILREAIDAGKYVL
jgi:hypothetical protein